MTPSERSHLISLFHARRYAELQTVVNIILEKEPDCGFAWQIAGATQEMLGQNGLIALSKATQYLPNDAGAHSNLAKALRDHGLFDAAVLSYRQALQLEQNFAVAHNGLGFTLRCLDKVDEAIFNYQQALAIKPDYTEAYNNLGNALFDRRQLDEAVCNYKRALKINPHLVETSDALLVALQFTTNTSSEKLFSAHRQYGEWIEAPLITSWPKHLNIRDPNKRLRVGYVSGDFRQHAVAYFIEPVLTQHDRKQIEVFCYSNSMRHDSFTDRLMTVTDHWQLCIGMTDDEFAERIRADEIDILVDLTGHASFNRLRAFARKPAPIQVTYLGYPGTTGLTAMDYRLTDNYVEPEDTLPCADQYYTENLIRLPDSLWCYRPHEGMPELTPLPALINGYITFGSFNNIKKVNSGCIALWARLLKSIPTSRLLMTTVVEGSMREHLTNQFAQFDVSPERLIYAGVMPPSEFHRKLQEVDITLDPIPVNGATTSCESLWLGVPVLTLVGERFLARAGLSVLSAANMHEFIAATPDEFIDKGVALANDLSRLAEIRANMRNKLRASPLLDQASFTRGLEAAFRQMWHKYLEANN